MRQGFSELVRVLSGIPGVHFLDKRRRKEWRWWIKFDIDIEHLIAWRVVQELGFILNFISLPDRLPIIFMPVSPPPYLNSGPEDCLSWVIESTQPFINPGDIAAILEGTLPDPIEQLDSWAATSE